MARFRTILLFLLALAFAACSSPYEGDSSKVWLGWARITIDSSSYVVNRMHFDLDSAGFYYPYPQLTLKTTYGDFSIANGGRWLDVDIDTVHHPVSGVYAMDTNQHIYLSISDGYGTTLLGDSGQMEIEFHRHDSAFGSISARMHAKDSSIHHLTVSFIASPQYALP